jgi:hypothetical protein
VGIVTHSTTEPFTKFVPVTVSVTPEGLQAGVVFDELVDADKPETVGGEIMNNWEAGQFATRIGAEGVTLNAVTHAGWAAVPVITKSAAGTVAVNSVGFPGEVPLAAAAGTYVVASLVVTLFAPVHWMTVQGRMLPP